MNHYKNRAFGLLNSQITDAKHLQQILSEIDSASHSLLMKNGMIALAIGLAFKI